MQSQNTAINSANAASAIEFSRNTIQFYHQFHHHTTETLQGFIGLMEYKVGGLAGALDELKSVGEYFIAMRTSLEGKESHSEAEQALLDTIAQVEPLQGKLERLYERLTPYFESPITGTEHTHIVSHTESQAVFKALNQGKVKNHYLFSEIEGEYLQLSIAMPKMPLGQHEYMVKANEFAKKSLEGFRHCINKYLSLWTDLTDNFVFSADKLDEIHADLIGIFVKFNDFKHAIRFLVSDSGLFNPDGKEFETLLMLDDQPYFKFFETYRSIAFKLSNTIEGKLGLNPANDQRYHQYQGLNKVLKELKKNNQHGDNLPSYFSVMDSWLQSNFEKFEKNESPLTFELPQFIGYPVNTFNRPNTASSIHKHFDKRIVRQISGNFANNFTLGNHSSIEEIQRQLIEVLPLWIEANCSVLHEMVGCSVSVNDVGVIALEDRLYITLWGYGSLYWLDIVDTQLSTDDYTPNRLADNSNSLKPRTAQVGWPYQINE